jgi:hypothetical protein
MDAAYFREKAEICSRLAKGLSWNNPARELAEEFQRQAGALEAPSAEATHTRRRARTPD